MKSSSLNEQAAHLADTMQDWNYAPTIGVLEIDGATTLNDIAQRIKETFEKAEPFEEDFYACTKEEMIKELRQCFAYDETPTHDVTARNISKETIKQEQEAFLLRLETYINDDSEVSSSDIESGLPIYYVFWKFAFVILNKDGKSLFLYGGASD